MAQSEGYSKCTCKHCGGRIEFPVAGAGSTIACPHCNQLVVLSAARAVAKLTESDVDEPRKKGVLGIVLVVAFALAAAGGGGYWYYVIRPASSAVDHANTNSPSSPKAVAPVVAEPTPPPDPWHGLMAGPVTLEKAKEGTLTYAVGKLRNTTDHQRFAVKVELDVLNDAGEKIGKATDYTGSIEPGKEWKFKAMVVDRTAKSATLVSVKED